MRCAVRVMKVVALRRRHGDQRAPGNLNSITRPGIEVGEKHSTQMIKWDRGRTACYLVAATACAWLAACGSGTSRSHRASNGATESSIRVVTSVSPHVIDLNVSSPAVGRTTVRLILPRDYDRRPSARWPVLYLLHGCCDSYLSWTRSTDVVHFFTTRDVLVVMPEGGLVGFYSDWSRGPRWETFHLIELIGLLQERYRASDIRAVAGVSMGGLGALDYAARHPGMFRAAASFSGIVDTRLSSSESAKYEQLLQANGGDPEDLWGDPHDNAKRWAEHNPTDLAAQLRRTTLFVSAGNGQPGPLDTDTTTPDPIEQSIDAENLAFTARLRQLNVPATVDLYGNGTHNWPYWQREFHKAWPLLARALGTD
jgi:diacylglycerol O-acyltransferase / trehalose O-mycolyltransferase